MNLFRNSLLDEEKDLQTIPGFITFFRTEPSLRIPSQFKARLNLTGEDLAEIRGLGVRIMKENELRDSGYEILSRAYFRELLVMISRKYDSRKQFHSIRMRTLTRMMEFIKENYSRPVSREEIVAAGNVSVSTASRIFNELLRKSMMDYLCEIRLGSAIGLLRNTDESISEIAARCGFSDSNYFSTLFHRKTGITPSQFRKRI